MLKGIDLSSNNVITDPSKIKESGIQFAVLREAFGVNSGHDPRFFEYVNMMKGAGIPILGVYHFSYALNEEAVIKEAQNCIERVQQAGLPKSCFIFFDLEYDTFRYLKERGITPTRELVNLHTRLFCDTINEAGYYTGIYTNLDYYRNWYDSSTLDKYHIWLADYSGGPDYNCMLQQISSKGTVNGINGYVDIDILYAEDVVTANIKEERPALIKDNETIAHEVISGKWSNGANRKKYLTEAGYDYATIQSIVNDILNGNAKKKETPTQEPEKNIEEVKVTDITARYPAQKYDKNLAGTYVTTADLYMRHGAGTDKVAMCQIPNGTKVKNYGYFSSVNGVKWLYIQVTLNGVKYTGFSSNNYLKK